MNEQIRLEEFQNFVYAAITTAPEKAKCFPVTAEEMLDEYDMIWAYAQTGPDQWEIWEYYPAQISAMLKIEQGWTGPNSIHSTETQCIDFIRGWLEDFAPAAFHRIFPHPAH